MLYHWKLMCYCCVNLIFHHDDGVFDNVDAETTLYKPFYQHKQIIISKLFNFFLSVHLNMHQNQLLHFGCFLMYYLPSTNNGINLPFNNIHYTMDNTVGPLVKLWWICGISLMWIGILTTNRRIGLPAAVKNCSINNQTQNSIEIQCLPGYDGGLPQVFVLELISSRTGKLR